MLLDEIEQLASRLSQLKLRAAAERLGALADTARSDASHSSSILPLTFANVDGVLMLQSQCSRCSADGTHDVDVASTAGSARSLAHAAPNSSDNGGTLTAPPEDGIDPRALALGLGGIWGALAIGEALDFDDNRLWAGGSIREPPGFDGVYFDDDSPDHVGDGVRDTRLTGRDDLGLGQHGRHMYCDYHDLNGTCEYACMAVDMLQQSRISTVIEKHHRSRQKHPRADRDGREARYACYKAVVAWQWANPLGAENRVRLPSCILFRVRSLFPNPCCRSGCDYLDGCEAAQDTTQAFALRSSHAPSERVSSMVKMFNYMRFKYQHVRIFFSHLYASNGNATATGKAFPFAVWPLLGQWGIIGSFCEPLAHSQLQKVEKVSAPASSHAWRRTDVSCASCASVADGAERCLGITHGLGSRRHEEQLLSPSCRRRAGERRNCEAVAMPCVPSGLPADVRLLSVALSAPH